MKLDLENDGATVRITGFGAGWLAINGKRLSGALRISNDSYTAIADPPESIEEFDSGLLDEVVAESPELVLIGFGAGFVSPPPALISRFAAEGIGVEVMSSAAAARTFNLIAGEGRKVVALLLPPS